MSEPSAPAANILVFFCDQLRLDLLKCYGGQLVRTPNLTALARESIVFDRAYTPTALCSPARASLMTGLYPHAHHMFNNSTPGYSYCEHLRPDLETLAGWVKRSTGYQTAYFGKWHIGPAADLFASAFDYTHPRPETEDLPFLANSHWHPNKSMGPLVQSYGGGAAGTIGVPMARFPDVAAADYTRRFLRSRRPADPPFLAFCAFPGPHSPWLLPEEFGIRYNPAEIPLWHNRHDPLVGKPLSQRKLRMLEMPDVRSSAREQDDATLRELLACCFSYIELIDMLVGEVLAGLKRCGLDDNTMVVFTADHGDMAGAHGFISKGSYMYDEIYRVPLIVKPVGQRTVARVAAPVHLMDVTATLMHVAGGEAVNAMRTHPLHGDSLVPLLEGNLDWPRAVHYAEYHGDWYGHYSARMVTDGQWKLVWNLFDLCELYDLEHDPGELHNRFYDDALADVRDRYFDALQAEARRYNDRQLALLSPAVETRQKWVVEAGI